MNMNRELNSRMFTRMENEQSHEEYIKEYAFYSNIVRGDTEAVKKALCDPENDRLYEREKYGRLSEDRLQNIRYHYVVSVALITRQCVENGLERELAYTLSDLYIAKMDKLVTSRQVLSLYNQMLMDYTEKMAALPKQQVLSIQVVKAINYICKHRTKKITAGQTAQALGINRSYLSTLFCKETGMSISRFIRKEKLDAAANMLAYSDFSYTEIAEYFGFSSQSHFISCFKKEMGCTPSEYRRRAYVNS